MKFILFTIAFLILSIRIYSQKSFIKIYFLNNDFESVNNLKEANVLLQVEKIHDSSYQYLYYNAKTLKATVLESYSDEEGNKANGIFVFYSLNGNVDSCGEVLNSKRHGSWNFYKSFSNKEDSLILIKKYDEGKLIEIKTEKEKLSAGFKEPTFDGFRKLLEQHLQYPIQAQDAGAQGIVTYNFSVNVEGKIENMYLFKTANYYLDLEAKRLINKTNGKWKPAILNGNKIIYPHKQSINFILGN
jgi:hypothetical protein